jgi:hypothetical protein
LFQYSNYNSVLQETARQKHRSRGLYFLCDCEAVQGRKILMQTMEITAKKRGLALLVAVIMALTLWTAVPLQASADSGSAAYLTYTTAADESGTTVATIIGYTGADKTTMTSIEIPATVGEGIPVTGIGRGAFSACTALAEITLAEGQDNFSVENGVLFNADKTILICYPRGKTDTSYTAMPNSVTSIAANAFSDALFTSLTIPNGVESIGYGAFVRSSLTSLTIPNSVKSLEGGLFQYCSQLESVTLPNGITSIGTYTFYGCTGLKSITIPNNVTTIGNYAFYGCNNVALTSVTIPDSVTSIGSYAFYTCTSLATVGGMNSVTTIGTYAFYGCTSLATVNGMNSVTIIDDSAFYNCTNLQFITIPSGVTKLGNNAFRACAQIAQTPVTLTNVETIGTGAFNGCVLLTSVVISSSNIEVISSSAFYDCTGLISVTLPDSVKIIDGYAFYGCTGLTSLVIPDSVTTINTYAFYGCSNVALTSVILPASVTIIGAHAFRGCTNLADVTILTDSDTIDFNANAFYGLTATLQRIWCYADTPAATFASTKATIMIKGIESINDDDGAIEAGLDLALEDEKELSVVYSPESHNETAANAPEVAWESSNANLVSVDGDGKITVADEGSGTALITATVTPHSGIELTASVHVTVAAEDEATLTLEVSKGTIIGTGPFVEGATVTIILDAVDTDEMVFTGWTDGSGSDASFTSLNQPMTVFTMPAENATVTANYKYITPSAAINYADETLTGLVPNASYSFGSDVDGEADAEGIYNIPESLTGKTLSIARKADENAVASDPAQTDITVPARIAAPDVSGVNETASGQNDGEITGITTDMQYKLTSDSTWTDVTDELLTENALTGLAPGTYQVRLKAIASDFASAAKTVTISAYLPPAPSTYAVTVTGGTDGANGTYADGATVNITANAPASGKVFDTWTTSDGVTFADASKAATSFVMPAKAVTVTATYKDDPKDSDGDGVPDFVEEQEGTDPADSCDFKDTDEDGVPDYIEIIDGTDPNDKNSFKDTNSDGIPDYVQEHPEPVTGTNGWAYEDGVWKFYADGEAATGWVYDGKAWYYLNASGEMQTGWVYDSNYKAWYYLSGNGAMVWGKWLHDTDGSWYYLSGNGAMVWSKWLHDTDGNWYYLSGNGKMLTGKQSIGGKVYSFKTNGAWIG